LSLVSVSRKLSARVARLKFDPPVTHVYNPLEYARAAHERYLERFGTPPKEVVLVGMNPGPFGMAQTGVPFGDVKMVRDWMGISLPVKGPANQHVKRPIQGFDCGRSEVSGSRLWAGRRTGLERRTRSSAAFSFSTTARSASWRFRVAIARRTHCHVLKAGHSSKHAMKRCASRLRFSSRDSLSE
jgi:single-strand selective monofunctional uracil DNA glycosylase